jgi:hypothetical protein
LTGRYVNLIASVAKTAPPLGHNSRRGTETIEMQLSKTNLVVNEVFIPANGKLSWRGCQVWLPAVLFSPAKGSAARKSFKKNEGKILDFWRTSKAGCGETAPSRLRR